MDENSLSYINIRKEAVSMQFVTETAFPSKFICKQTNKKYRGM